MKNLYYYPLLFIVSFFAVFSSFHTYAQTGWQWGIGSIQDDSSDYDPVTSAADKSGNLFFAAYAWGDTILLGTFPVYPGADGKMVISKTDTSGHVLWLLESSGYTVVSQMATDDSGNLYVYGTYDTLLTMGTMILTAPGNSCFLLKVAPSGSVLWAQNIYSSDMWCNLGVDGAGNSYITGGFFDSLTVGTTLLLGSYTASSHFIEKYSSSGGLVWAKSFGVSCTAETSQIAVSESGDIYIYGIFLPVSPDTSTWHLTIGSTVLTVPFGAYGSTIGIFLAKFDSSGYSPWAQLMNYPFTIYAMTTDNADRLYVTGELDGNIILGVDTLTDAGGGDAFVAKYDSAGHLSWANSAGGITRDNGQSIAIDLRGNVWIVGRMSSSSIAPSTYTMNFNGHSLTQSGCVDAAFMARYDSAGHYISALALKSGADDYIGTAVDNCGSVYAGGDYCLTQMVFGMDTLNASTSLLYPEYFFVAKYRYDTSGCFEGGRVNSYNHIDTVVCAPSDISSISLTAPFGTSYLWYDGATASTHIEYATGIYWVAITTATDFIVDTFHVTFTSTSPPCNSVTGLNKNLAASQNDISIYPNPASTKLTILSTNQPINKVAITNLLGQTLYTQNYSSPQVQIDVSSLPSGLYFIKVNGSEVRKFVKE